MTDSPDTPPPPSGAPRPRIQAPPPSRLRTSTADGTAAARAAFARQRRRDEIEKRARDRRRSFFRIGGLVFAVLCLIALAADLRRVSSDAAAGDASLWNRFRRASGIRTRGLAPEIAANFGKAPRYTSPDGHFSVEPPYGWRPRAKAGLGIFDAAFDGPLGMDFCIQTTYSPGATEGRLWRRLQRIEREMQANSRMAFSYIGPRRVILREARLYRNKVLFIDFVTGDLMHHIQFAAPPEVFDEYKPLFLEVMESYEPGSVLSVPSAEPFLLPDDEDAPGPPPPPPGS